MTNAVSIYPPYSIIFVSDESDSDMPEYQDRRISANTEALLVPCAAEVDSPTKITLVPSSMRTSTALPQFDGFITTPMKCVVVSTALTEVVLRLPVPSIKTRLRVFTNDLRFPDEILIVAD